ncbi:MULTISPECIES: hypothetical protein [Sphingomonas]|nr:MULTISPECIES: hypothetical protein [Sphingomonas]MBB4047222.1 hypothetical protein [Sphingomonas zeae]MDK8186316.1 hypothetical protein [Sphingomonas zeae]MDK8216063.1 hypothetical protein [Sphingomonas sp. UMB7805-LC452B]
MALFEVEIIMAHSFAIAKNKAPPNAIEAVPKNGPIVPIHEPEQGVSA